MNLKNHRKQFIKKLRKLCEDNKMCLNGTITHVYVRKDCNYYDVVYLDFSSHRKSVASIARDLFKK